MWEGVGGHLDGKEKIKIASHAEFISAPHRTGRLHADDLASGVPK